MKLIKFALLSILTVGCRTTGVDSKEKVVIDAIPEEGMGPNARSVYDTLVELPLTEGDKFAHIEMSQLANLLKILDQGTGDPMDQAASAELTRIYGYKARVRCKLTQPIAANGESPKIKNRRCLIKADAKDSANMTANIGTLNLGGIAVNQLEFSENLVIKTRITQDLKSGMRKVEVCELERITIGNGLLAGQSIRGLEYNIDIQDDANTVTDFVTEIRNLDAGGWIDPNVLASKFAKSNGFSSEDSPDRKWPTKNCDIP